MNDGALWLHLVNLLYIGLLPRIFFKKDGVYNAAWWGTALPFLANSLLFLLALVGLVDVPAFLPGIRVLLTATSMLLAAGSIALIAYTLGTHRIPISLWHQTNDAPVQIVTWGAYARVRHPFYAAFLLALVAEFIYLPHATTLLALVYGFWRLDATARREEAALRTSAFGAEYEAYVARTGRFWPRAGRPG